MAFCGVLGPHYSLLQVADLGGSSKGLEAVLSSGPLVHLKVRILQTMVSGIPGLGAPWQHCRTLELLI